MTSNSSLAQIIGSVVDFQGDIQFINNTEKNGAVSMHLVSFGQARIFSGLRMSFSGNKGMYVILCLMCNRVATMV